ncbi:MAG: V-type ATP synthase subunit E, partial [Sediminispirochaetaceae bacterium]
KREETGRASLKQAGRDVILSVEKRLQEIFDRIIHQETSQVLKGNILEEAVMQVVKNWDSDVTDLKVLIAEDELKKIEENLREKLSTKLAEGVEIKPLPKTEAGFQISMKDGSAYYNFTAEGIAELLSQFLNPRLAEILKEAAEEKG